MMSAETKKKKKYCVRDYEFSDIKEKNGSAVQSFHNLSSRDFL